MRKDAEIALDHYIGVTIREELQAYLKMEGTKDVDTLLKRINQRLVSDMKERAQLVFNKTIEQIKKLTDETMKGK